MSSTSPPLTQPDHVIIPCLGCSLGDWQSQQCLLQNGRQDQNTQSFADQFIQPTFAGQIGFLLQLRQLRHGTSLVRLAIVCMFLFAGYLVRRAKSYSEKIHPAHELPVPLSVR